MQPTFIHINLEKILDVMIKLFLLHHPKLEVTCIIIIIKLKISRVNFLGQYDLNESGLSVSLTK